MKIACDYLVPKGFDTFIWKTLTPDERFYLKGLDMESHGEYRSGAYQELARGFGIREYTDLLATGKANETHLKTATDFGTKLLNKDSVFSTSLVRNALFAIREVVRSEEVSSGKNWLRNEVLDYWNQRKTLIEILKGELEPDVVETACLAHDLGHPPFGHIAEKELDNIAISVHDLEDFYLAGLIPINVLVQKEEEWQNFLQKWLESDRLTDKDIRNKIQEQEEQKRLKSFLSSYIPPKYNPGTADEITYVRASSSLLIQRYIQSASISENYGKYGYLE